VPAFPTGSVAIGLTTFALALAGGVLPFVSIEAYVLALSAASPQADLVPVALAATLGQMLGKSVVYLAGAGVLELRPRQTSPRLRAVIEYLAGTGKAAMAVIFASAAVSVPPLYPASFAAGALRVRFAWFLAAGCAGAFLRFAVLFSLPRLLG
jgi:membrane protein YqaA with SNARE-associated domain